jgi:hypothetical protein
MLFIHKKEESSFRIIQIKIVILTNMYDNVQSILFHYLTISKIVIK